MKTTSPVLLKWFADLGRNVAAFFAPMFSLPEPRSGYQPLVEFAPDAFPFVYRSPYLHSGYQPTDTPPPQNPPQSVLSSIPYGYSTREVADALATFFSGLKVLDIPKAGRASYVGAEQWTRDHEIMIVDEGYEVSE